MFHALGRFIFKRQCWQNMMIYGTSEYCAWLSPCYTVLYVRGFFDGMIWTPWKSAKTHSDLGSRVQQDLQDLGHFSQNFGFVTARIESDVKGDINAISYSRNKWRIFLILVRIWNQRKRWLGSWYMSDRDVKFWRVQRFNIFGFW